MSSNKRKPMKLYTRIVLFFVGTFAVLLIFSSLMVFYFSQQIIFNENRSNLVKFNSYIINVIKENEASILSQPTNARLDYISEKIYPNIKDNNLISYKISDNMGNSYLSTDAVEEILDPANFPGYNIDLYKLHVDSSLEDSKNVSVDSFRYNKIEYYYLGSRYSIDSSYTIYIQVVKNLNDSFVFMTTLSAIQIAMSILFVIITIIVGIYGTKGSFKPLIQISETARNITENNLNTRIPETGNADELDQLSRSLNQMIEQLEGAFNIQKRFVADASHELRIPLTVIQGYADILENWGTDNPQLFDESITAIDEEITNMRKLIDGLLFLTRLENNYFTQKFEPINLTPLAEKTCNDFTMIDTHHLITLKAEGDYFINGNEALLQQALRALLENSVKYTPEGGGITISCSRDALGHTVLSVEDTGIGIPEKDIADVTKRFYRVSDDRSRETGGTGLGLSIIDSIIKHHHGTLQIKSTLGKGTRIDIIFP